MRIRPCLLSDIPTATSLASQAFLNDALFAASNPHRKQYPQDFRASFAPRFRARILARNCLALVAETDPGDKTAHGTVSAGGEVVGIAFWVRDGDDGERRVNAYDGVLLGTSPTSGDEGS